MIPLVHSHSFPGPTRKGLSVQSEDGHAAVTQDYIVKFKGDHTNHVENLLQVLSEYSDNADMPDFEAKIKWRLKHLFDGAVLTLSPEAFEWLKEDFSIDKMEADAQVWALGTATDRESCKFQFYLSCAHMKQFQLLHVCPYFAMSVVKSSNRIRRSLDDSVPWNLDRVDQRTGPLNGNYEFDSAGKNVNVYVVDTGIRRTHCTFNTGIVHCVLWPTTKPILFELPVHFQLSLKMVELTSLSIPSTTLTQTVMDMVSQKSKHRYILGCLVEISVPSSLQGHMWPVQ